MSELQSPVVVNKKHVKPDSASGIRAGSKLMLLSPT